MTNDPAEVGRTRTINAASVSAPGGYLGENHGPAEFQRLWRSSLLAENHHFRSCCLGPSFPCCRFFRDQPLGCRVLGSRFDQLGRGIVFYEVFPLATRAFHCVAINLADNYLSPRLITPTRFLLQSTSRPQGCLAAFGPTRPRFKLLYLAPTGNFVLRSHPLGRNVT